MGSTSNYSSPKTSYSSSFSMPSTPKSSSYESSKVSSVSMPKTTTSESPSSISSILKDEFVEEAVSPKSNLNSLKDLFTSLLEVNESIEKTEKILNGLQKRKTELEEKLSSNPEYEKISEIFDSINNSKGPKR